MNQISIAEGPVQQIVWHDQPLVYIIRASMAPVKTTFLTPPEFKQQVGFVVYQKGGEIMRHIHLNLERRLVGTSEVLIIRRGHCYIDIYSKDQDFKFSRILSSSRSNRDPIWMNTKRSISK